VIRQSEVAPDRDEVGEDGDVAAIRAGSKTLSAGLPHGFMPLL
jgi:hypothetical protein